MNGIRCGRGAQPRATVAGAGQAKRSIVRFSAAALAVLAAGCAILAAAGGQRLSAIMFAWTAPVIILFSVLALFNARFLRGMNDVSVYPFGAANSITALRIFLVSPVLVLLFEGKVLAATILYAAGALSDVADGAVARRFGRETMFGVMLDPVADILSTSAVFSWLWLSGGVPGWLFGLLIVRYVQFFGGLAGLSASGRLPRLRATAAGKVAGVVQGVAIAILLVRAAFPAPGMDAAVERVVVPVLGTAFAAVIVSQTVIGIRAVRRNDAA